ncbi:hypothetical protein JKP88DRAFT_261719 [Tribonema minus]|uniref:DUF962 domain-containing protein n=1 Tax=Tribonema minus TaxID=303371 RepID=A0A835ZKQ2_9STRA|nr:hypothetical protein JKP88DRAFT_261719 [Tribonema minus]
MGLKEVTDLDKHLAFYCAYHRNTVNEAIHMVCIWPIVWTMFALFRMLGPTAPVPHALVDMAPALGDALVLHIGWLIAAAYVLLYPLMEPRMGTAAALLVVCCLLSANQFAAWADRQPESDTGLSAAAYVAVAHVVCWLAQFYGHAAHEKRKPALMDNLFQAFLAAPLFVLLTLFHYPSDVFTRIQPRVDEKVAEFRRLSDAAATAVSKKQS